MVVPVNEYDWLHVLRELDSVVERCVWLFLPHILGFQNVVNEELCGLCRCILASLRIGFREHDYSVSQLLGYNNHQLNIIEEGSIAYLSPGPFVNTDGIVQCSCLLLYPRLYLRVKLSRHIILEGFSRLFGIPFLLGLVVRFKGMCSMVSCSSLRLECHNFVLQYTQVVLYGFP